MAVTIGAATYIKLRVTFTDYFGETKTIEIDLAPDTSQADLIAMVTGINDSTNAGVKAEVVQVSTALGTRAAAVNALQDTVRVVEELVFSAQFPEVRPKGIAYKTIGLPAPVGGVYTNKGKIAASGLPATWAAMITALQTNMVRARYPLDQNVPDWSTGFTLGGGQMISTGDVIGDDA